MIGSDIPDLTCTYKELFFTRNTEGKHLSKWLEQQHMH